MAEVLLFHHAQGLTPGVVSFADQLRAAGHVVHTPDLYEGKTFSTLTDGVGYAEQVGFGTIAERGRQAAEGLPKEIVYGGFSLGVVSAQSLAQTEAGATGVLLFSSAIPPSELDGEWPQGVPAQIHMMESDEWVIPPNEDLQAARSLADSHDTVKLFLYPGDRHLFADNSLPEYDKAAANLLTKRVLDFLSTIQ